MVSKELQDKVLARIDGDELIDLVARMIKINSVWDPEAGTCEQPAAELAAEFASAQGFDVTLEQVAPGRPNVLVNWQCGPGERRLMFEGHTDVVATGDPAEWKYDPFGAEIVNGRMYGRGTNDTKGNMCAMLYAMTALKRSGVELNGSIVGGVLCDEEDTMIGVLDFITKGHADDVTAAIICEPQDGMICTSQKGAVRAKYSISGRQAHGAMPLSGLNTAPAVARIIDGLAELELEAITRFGRHEHLKWPSFSPTVIKAPASGPAQLNVMPGQTEIWVDVRTVPAQNHDEIRTALSDLAEKAAAQCAAHYADLDAELGLDRDRELKVEVVFITDRPCTDTPDEDPVVLAADRATRAVWDIEPVYGGVPGATDGTYLWSMKNVPIVTMGAGDRYVPHQVDEWVDLQQLVDTAKIYALAALDYLSPGQED